MVSSMMTELFEQPASFKPGKYRFAITWFMCRVVLVDLLSCLLKSKQSNLWDIRSDEIVSQLRLIPSMPWVVICLHAIILITVW